MGQFCAWRFDFRNEGKHQWISRGTKQTSTGSLPGTAVLNYLPINTFNSFYTTQLCILTSSFFLTVLLLRRQEDRIVLGSTQFTNVFASDFQSEVELTCGAWYSMQLEFRIYICSCKQTKMIFGCSRPCTCILKQYMYALRGSSRIWCPMTIQSMHAQ